MAQRQAATKGVLIEKIARVHAWKNVNGARAYHGCLGTVTNNIRIYRIDRINSEFEALPPLLLRPLTLLINKQQHCSHRYFHYKAIRLHNAGSAGLILTRKWPPTLPSIAWGGSNRQEFQIGLLNNEKDHPWWSRMNFPSSSSCFNFFRGERGRLVAERKQKDDEIRGGRRAASQRRIASEKG